MKHTPRKISVFIIFLAAVGMVKPALGNLYITIKGADVKKATLAVGAPHALPGYVPTSPAFSQRLTSQLIEDLRFTQLFELVPQTKFIDLDKPKSVTLADFKKFSDREIALYLKTSYKVNNKNLIMEAQLFDVASQKRIIGTRYQYSLQQYPRLIHALTEDILKKLTGETGLFRSRVLMVCRENVKRKKTRRGARTGIIPKNIYVADPDGRNLTQVTFDRTLSLNPSWSPDGKYITYTQYEYRRRKGRTKVIPVLKKHDLSSGKRVVISDRDGMNSGASWAPSGKKIAATLSYTGRPELYIIDPQGKKPPKPLSRAIRWRRISGKGFEPNYASLLFDVEPSWSPDGSQIVFSSARSGHPMIYTVNVKSRIANQLTFAGTYNSSPDWSKKSDKILFAAQRIGTGNFDIYQIDPDGNNLKRITRGYKKGRRRVHYEDPSWAPTGRHFAFSSNESGKYAVYVMSVDGKNKKRISPRDRECTTPFWGPFEG